MRHILVVDDEVDLAMLFKSFLEDNGYRVTVAHNGVAALECIACDPADAVITDLTMPRMGGRELVERLRIRRPELPAIFVSGYAGDEDLSGRWSLVFSKPVSLVLLVRRLDGLLSGAHTSHH